MTQPKKSIIFRSRAMYSGSSHMLHVPASAEDDSGEDDDQDATNGSALHDMVFDSDASGDDDAHELALALQSFVGGDGGHARRKQDSDNAAEARKLARVTEESPFAGAAWRNSRLPVLLPTVSAY